ncbi:MAG TPA: Rieske 2Fe-2S domain-containing protein [Nitrososphaera sp.]|nr:Rieske 2Fe-2S domain-containing protein [Nitrososphaera sp.]
MTPAYRKVANIRELKEGGILRVQHDGRPIILVVVKGRIYAMDATCSHEGGPLDEGTLEGYNLTCPWHSAIFDVRNAKVSDQTVWATDLQSYPVKVDEATGDIMLSLQGVEAAMQGKQPDNEGPQKQEGEKKRKAAGTSNLYLELLQKKKLEGTDIVTFTLSRGDGGGYLDYLPGQYAFFKLERVSGDPRGPVRHFSLASSPTEQDFIIVSTRIRDSPYKQALAALEIGAKILAWGPQGKFVLDEESGPAVFLSGGIGVTPFRSMIKYATDKNLPRKIVMFDSNRNEGNILYKQEFDTWVGHNKNLKVVYTLSDEDTSARWAGERGRIDRRMIEKHLGRSEIEESTFYICGPPAMLKAMQKLLDELQVPKERIRTEEFTGY